jgi:hypothetical protein
LLGDESESPKPAPQKTNNTASLLDLEENGEKTRPPSEIYDQQPQSEINFFAPSHIERPAS